MNRVIILSVLSYIVYFIHRMCCGAVFLPLFVTRKLKMIGILRNSYDSFPFLETNDRTKFIF